MIIEKRGGAKILLSGWKPFEYCPLLECVPRQSISKLLVGVWVWGWVCKETWLLDWPTNAVGDCRASSKVSTNQRASWGRLFSSDMAAGRFCIGHCSFPPPTRHLFISSTALKKKKRISRRLIVFIAVAMAFNSIFHSICQYYFNRGRSNLRNYHHMNIYKLRIVGEIFNLFLFSVAQQVWIYFKLILDLDYWIYSWNFQIKSIGYCGVSDNRFMFCGNLL